MLIKINRRPVYVVARGWPALVRILAEHLTDKPPVAANSLFQIFFMLAFTPFKICFLIYKGGFMVNPRSIIDYIEIITK